MKSHTRVCCRHFPGGDITKDPQTGLGKRFASPKKKDTPRAKRANRREVTKHWSSLLESPAGHSRSTTPLSKSPDPVREQITLVNHWTVNTVCTNCPVIPPNRQPHTV